MSFATWLRKATFRKYQLPVRRPSRFRVETLEDRLAPAIDWAAAASGNWSDASRWAGGQVPTIADAATVTPAGGYTVSLTGPAFAKQLAVGGASGTQTLAVGANALTTPDGVTIAATGALTLAGGTLAAPGSAAFAARADAAVPFNELVAVGDLNADGRPDAVVTGQFGTSATALVCQAGGGFTSVGSPIGLDPRAITIADLTGDGKPDLALLGLSATYVATVDVYAGDGAGGFAATPAAAVTLGGVPRGLAAADLDADGRLDLVAPTESNDLRVLRNTSAAGATSFASQTVAVGQGQTAAAVADFDANGKADVAVTTFNSSVVVLSQQAGGTFTTAEYAVAAGPQAVAAFDATGDGKPDVVTANAGTVDTPPAVGIVTLLAGTGSGFTRTDLTIGANTDPRAVFARASEAPGKLDILVGTAAGLTLFENYGPGGFARTDLPLANGANAAAALGGDLLGLTSTTVGDPTAALFRAARQPGVVTVNGALAGGGTVAGGFAQTASGVLETRWASAASFDALAVAGSATLGGTLRLNFTGTPASGTNIDVLTASAVSGTFSKVESNLPASFTLTPAYSATGVRLTVTEATGGGFAAQAAAFRDGVQRLRDRLPDWAGLLDGGLGDYPVLPAAYTAAVRTALTNLVPTIATAATETALRDALTAAGYTAVSVNAAAADVLVSARFQHTFTAGLTGTGAADLPVQLDLGVDLTATSLAGTAIDLTVGLDQTGFFVSSAGGLTLPTKYRFGLDQISVLGDRLTLSGAGELSPTHGVAFDAARTYLPFGTTSIVSVSDATTTGEAVDTLRVILDAGLTVPGLRAGAGEANLTLHGDITKAGWDVSVQADDLAGYQFNQFAVTKLGFGVKGLVGDIAALTVSGNFGVRIDPDGNGPIDLFVAGTVGSDALDLAGSLTIDRTIRLGGRDVLGLKNTTLAGRFKYADFDDASTIYAKVSVTSDQAVLFPTAANPATGLVSVTKVSDPLFPHALQGSLDSTGAFSLTVGKVAFVVQGLASFAAERVTVNLRPNMSATDSVFTIGSATAKLDALSAFLGGAPTLSATGLGLTAGGQFMVSSIAATLPVGYTSRLGIAEFVPFELSGLEVGFPQGQDGVFSNFTLGITGKFDGSVLQQTFGFTPVIRIGTTNVATGANVSIKLAIDAAGQGKFAILDASPITLGVENMKLGPVVLDGSITLGGYLNGELQTWASGHFGIDLSAAGVGIGDTSTGTGLDVSGFTVDLAGNYSKLADGGWSLALSGKAAAAFRFRLASVIDFSDVTIGGTLRFTKPAGGDLDFSAALDNVGFGRLSVGVGDFVKITATNGALAFTQDPTRDIATLGSLSLSFATPAGQGSGGADRLLGMGGTLTNLAIGPTGLPRLNGVGVEITPPNVSKVFDWLPISIDKVGLKFHADLFETDPSGNYIVGINNPAAFSITFSGGLQSDAKNDQGNPIFPLVASVTDVTLNVAKLARGEFPIENLGGIRIGVQPFTIGPVKIGGMLSFGSVPIADDPVNAPNTFRTVYYGRVVGAFAYDGIGAGVDLVISDRGPVLATLSIPLAIPLDAAGVVVLSQAAGSIGFGVQSIPVYTDPNQLDDLPLPTTVISDGVIAAQLRQLRPGDYTWTKSMSVALQGTLISPYLPGVISGDATLGAYIGFDLADSTGGLKFFGQGAANLFGMGLADARFVLDLHDPLAPVLNAKATMPVTGSALGYLLPLEGDLTLALSTKGVVQGVLVGLNTFVDKTASAALDVGQSLFADAFNLMASELRVDSTRPLARYLLGPTGDPAQITTAWMVGRLKELFLYDSLFDNTGVPVGGVVINPAVLQNAAKAGVAFMSELFERLGDLLADPARAVGNAAALDAAIAGPILALFRGDAGTLARADQAMLAFLKAMQDAALDGLVRFGQTAEPSLVVKGLFQPAVFGIPLGPPKVNGTLVINKEKIGLETTVIVPEPALILALAAVPALSSPILTLPFPLTTANLTFGFDFPFGESLGNSVIDVFKGKLVTVDPNNGGWAVSASGSFTLLGTMPLAQVSGAVFPADWEKLAVKIDRRFDKSPTAPYPPDTIPVRTLTRYLDIQAYGGMLFDASLGLPQLVTNPQAVFARIGAPPSDPAEILDWIKNLGGELQSNETVGNVQAYLPSFVDLVDFNFRDATSLVTGDQARVKAKLTATVEAFRERFSHAYLEGVLNGKLLGVSLADGQVEGTSRGITATGFLRWLTATARVSFDIGSKAYTIDGRTITLPTAGADIALDRNDSTFLRAIGLNPAYVPFATDGDFRFRAYTPGFDANAKLADGAPDTLKVAGGLEVRANLSINGLVKNAGFVFRIAGAEAGAAPRFTASASVAEFDLLGAIGGLRITNAGLTLSNETADGRTRLTLDAAVSLLGHAGRVTGTLNADLTGDLTITLGQDRNAIALAAGFTLAGTFTLKLTRDANGTLRAAVAYSGSLTPPAWLGGTAITATGTINPDGTFDIALSQRAVPGGVVSPLSLLKDTSFRFKKDAAGLFLTVSGQAQMFGQTFAAAGDVRILAGAGANLSGELTLTVPRAGLTWGGFVMTPVAGGFVKVAFGGDTVRLTVANLSVALPGIGGQVTATGSFGTDGVGRLTLTAGRDGLTLGAFRLTGSYELAGTRSGTVAPVVTLTGSDIGLSLAGFAALAVPRFSVSSTGAIDVKVNGSTFALPTPDGRDGPFRVTLPDGRLQVVPGQTFRLSVGGGELSLPLVKKPLALPAFEIDLRTGDFDRTLPPLNLRLNSFFEVHGRLRLTFTNGVLTVRLIGVGTEKPSLRLQGIGSVTLDEFTLSTDGTFRVAGTGDVGPDFLRIVGAKFDVSGTRDGDKLDLVLKVSDADLQLPTGRRVAIDEFRVDSKTNLKLAFVLPRQQLGEVFSASPANVILEGRDGRLSLTQSGPATLSALASTLTLSDFRVSTAPSLSAAATGRLLVGGLDLADGSFGLSQTDGVYRVAGSVRFNLGPIRVTVGGYVASNGDYDLTGTSRIVARLGDIHLGTLDATARVSRRGGFSLTLRGTVRWFGEDVDVGTLTVSRDGKVTFRGFTIDLTP